MRYDHPSPQLRCQGGATPFLCLALIIDAPLYSVTACSSQENSWGPLTDE